MALVKKGKYLYGITIGDLEAEIVRYSLTNTYPAVRFRQSRCNCGSVAFKLESDEDVGAARRICGVCDDMHLIGDSSKYSDDASFDNHVCVCGHEQFQLLSGVALYEDSNDIRWYYIGCLCFSCQLVGVFADWKCEAGDSDAFLIEV